MKAAAVFKQERKYRLLFTAGLINGIGDRFSQVAVLSLLFSVTGSGLAVGITFAVRLIPFLIFGPLGGLIADRYSKKTIMIATDLVRIAFALSPLLVREASDVWIVYLSSFLLAAGEALYAPARSSSIPSLVSRENLLVINGLEQAMVGFVLICGSITGGVIAAAMGTQVTFVLNALSFLLTALLISRIAIPHSSSAMQPSVAGDNGQPSRWKTVTEVRDLFRGSPFLRMMLILFALWPIGDGIFNILLSVYAVDVFQMGEVGIGILYGALGIGLVVGAGLTSKVSGAIRAAACAAVLAEGIVNMLISQTRFFPATAGLLIVTAVFAAIGGACSRTILMNATPARLQGRLFGLLASVQNTVMGITMLLSGFALDWLSPRSLGLTGGILFTLVGVMFALGVYRHQTAADGFNLKKETRA